MPVDLEDELVRRGAILRGHFRLASGRHAETYIEKFRILQWPDITSELCCRIADRFRGEVSLVAGPTTGGVILAFETARQLGVRCVIAERAASGPGREFRRGFEVGSRDRVLVVDDVLTTGGSINEVLEALANYAVPVTGVGVLIDRSGGRADFDVPLFACLTLDIASWAPEACGLCRDRIPLIIT